MKKFALLTPLLLSACFPVVLPVHNPAEQAPNIYGGWRLVAVEGRAPADEEAVFTVNSSDNGFSVATACSKIKGKYATGERHGFVIDGLTADNQCSADEPEAKIAAGLTQVRHYRFESRRLELLDEQGRVVLVGKRLSDARTVTPSDSGETAYFQDTRHN